MLQMFRDIHKHLQQHANNANNCTIYTTRTGPVYYCLGLLCAIKTGLTRWGHKQRTSGIVLLSLAPGHWHQIASVLRAADGGDWGGLQWIVIVLKRQADA